MKKLNTILIIYFTLCTIAFCFTVFTKSAKESSLHSPSEIEKNKNNTPQKIDFVTIDNKPKLIEARVQREAVPLANYYEFDVDARLISLKFADIVHNGKKLKLQFSLSPKDYFDDFGDENWFHIYMPVGKNTITIRAVDSANKFATQYTTINTFSKKAISKYVWFWPSIWVLLLFPLFYYFYKKAILAKQFEFNKQLALQQQQQQITADIHDDIGATLSSLQINSAVANKYITQHKYIEAQQLLLKIETQTETLADKMGDIVWSLKAPEDELMNMSTRIKNFTKEILEPIEIFYTLDINTTIDRQIIDYTTKKNIILITKEAINNAAKYSKATQIDIALQVQNNHITITIKDNGIGFNATETKGNGIGNMQQRAKDCGGEIEIIASIGNGTAIFFKCPISK